MTFELFAAPKVRYRYGESWWYEYEADRETSLLLHFGKPQPKRAKELAKQVEGKRTEKAKEKKEDAELTTLEEDLRIEGGQDDPGGEFKVAQPEEMKKTLPPVNDSNVPPGLVLDYGDNRRRFKIEKGVSIVPDGKFGAALKCDGTDALVCRGIKYASPLSERHNRSDTGQSIECWIKIESYPDVPACIWRLETGKYSNTTGAHLLLLPGGRIELRLDLPHGRVSKGHNSKEAVEAILARDADIISPEPVPLNQWTHVLCYNDPPVVQGMGSPFKALLRINGRDVASYISEPNNSYNFLGREGCKLLLGKSDEEDMEGFKGLIDEIRICNKRKSFYDRPPIPWADEKRERPLQFDKPYFLANGTVLHASLDSGLKYDINKSGSPGVMLDLMGGNVDQMYSKGIRGKSWVIDPQIGFPKFSLKGMNVKQGSLEFWLRPENWDNQTGLWPGQSAPHPMRLSVARFYGRDKRDGQTKMFMNATLPRIRRFDGNRTRIEPGYWQHYIVRWKKDQPGKAVLYLNARGFSGVWRAGNGLLKNLEPEYVEFGISDKITVSGGARPLIHIDEVVGYSYNLSEGEREQALRRWKTKLESFKPYSSRLSYKYSIGKLEFSLSTKLPLDVTPTLARVRLLDQDKNGEVVLGPFEKKIENKRVSFVLCDRNPLPHAKYRLKFEVIDERGKVAIDAHKDWNFIKEPWRGNRIGFLDKTPPPWTPVKISKTAVETRMTKYQLGANGLPTEIIADGVNLLASPIQLLEDNKPLKSKSVEILGSQNVEASWKTSFAGETCDIDIRNTVEYDGMHRYEITIRQKGKVGRIQFVIPMKSEQAKRWMFNPAGRTGVRTGIVPDRDGTFLSSRRPAFWSADYHARRRKKERPKWEEFQAYAFFTQFDLNDMNRGLYWFADHGGGWHQSKTVDAQEFIRKGGTTSVVLNLVAEPVEYRSDQPIVFGIIPHPARPLPRHFRLLERASPKEEPKFFQAYGSAFKPWPMDPRSHRGTGATGLSMKLFPAPDPDEPDNPSPSWDYAERCIRGMKDVQPKGFRSMYLSNYWFSCRAGAYDHWEWRGGPTSQVTHSQSFVDYLCWEMNEWIRRDIFDAIYLDECYEAPSRNVEAGQACRLPDGSVQPGVTLWGFRQLMKRWRNIFHQNDLEPMFTCHLTRSMMYCGMTFVDSYLDGEGHPTITARSGSFVDRLSLTRAEVLQSGRMWGVTPFFMVSIWEGGLGMGKGWNPHKRWSWRMARGAMSLLAHFENGTTYTDQGGYVYRHYWNDVLRWGAGDLGVPFHSYWNNGDYLEVEGQGKATLVSFYQKANRILLIASNRKKEIWEIRVKLNLDRLGLKGKLNVVHWDTGYPPAKGDDILSKVELARLKNISPPEEDILNAKAARDNGFEETEDLVEKLEADEEKGKDNPRLEGNVLILPTRPQDFRMVSIEEVE